MQVMAGLSISLSVCNYDRTAALFDGRVGVEGCDVHAVPLEPEESFHRAFKYGEFDVCEISMSSHCATTARGANEYVAIPAFVSRLFRHSGIYIRTDRGIDRPQDLKGKTIGLPEYQITANVWIRGILEDEYGVKPADIRWRRGGLEEAGRDERSLIKLPDDVELKQVPDDRTLSQMLERGELDGLISARAPSCFLQGAPNIARLFPDYPATEADYFKRTRNFPIMHAIGIRKSILERHPWLAVSFYKAFIRAKELCMHEMGQIGHLFTSLPWGVAEYERMKTLMGEDYWSYGIDANRHVLETFLRYHYEQGLSTRQLKVEDIFAASTFELTKI
jgi:4,5-dihydroxyphthalate decarboxylase